jgi:two-component system, response regulator
MVEITGSSFIILLVEDNVDHADLIVRNLNKHQKEKVIYHAGDGEKALDFLFHRGDYESPERSPRPDLILLDLRLPKIDGLEVLKTIKETGDLMQIPVVILTSSDAEIDIARAYDYRANSYVVKPFESRKFSQLMEELHGYWLGWNTPTAKELS